MSNPRYVPRDFLFKPELFGKPGVGVQWRPRPASIPEVDWFLASAIQQSFAARIQAAIKASQEYRSVPDFAEKAGIKYKTFNGMLNGSSVMALEDIAMARRLLGIDLNVWGTPDPTP
jgi:hypothetical protein